MSDCIFCKIVAGEIPSYKIYEDEHVYGFLDINPVGPGHTLLIPKVHSENLLESSDEHVDELMRAVKKVAPSILKAVGSEGFNLVNNYGAIAGQTVFHTHFHIIPRFPDDGHRPWHGHGAAEDVLTKVAEDIKAKM